MFEEKLFEEILGDGDRYLEFMFTYFCFKVLKNIKKNQSKDKKDKFGESKYAKALRYGDVAVAMICKYSFYKEDFDIEYIEKKVNTILTKWSSFESFAFSKKTNIKYFDKKASVFNYY